jgi:acetylornithine aminotransferase
MNLFDVYPLFDIHIVEGKGCRVWDENGAEYLDLYGGHAVISIGHSHPKYVEMIGNQASKLGFYSNSVVNKLQEEVARRLGTISGYDDYSLFLINSGAEANENALKLASFHNGRTRIVAFDKAFHGRTSLAVEATDNPKIIAPVNDNRHVTWLPLNDTAAVKTELAKGDVCAVIIEGIQGVGGIRVPEDNFLREVRKACTETGTILILDEIQSGYGRSGKFFAHQYAGIKPDIITVAKGIGNGFPLAAVLISPMFTPVYGMLGTTFGGNHLACAAALAVIDVMEKERLTDNAAKVGAYLIEELRKFPQIKEVRGRGLMIGLEFDEPVKELRSKLLFEQKVFTGATGTHVIRLLPPLCLSRKEADLFLERFNLLCQQFLTTSRHAESEVPKVRH